MTTARDLLRPCPTVRDTETVGNVIPRLQASQNDYYAVIDSQERLVGILTEFDVVKLVYESGQFESDAIVGSLPAYLGYSREQLRALPVTEIMTADPETVASDTDLDTLITLAFRNHRKVLPVVEKGKVLGAVLRTDLLLKVLG